MTQSTIFICIVSTIISISIILICRYFIPWIRTKLKQSNLEFISDWVMEAVHAAEQKYGDGQGKVKKEEVVKFLHDILESHGIKLTEQEIDTLIESAVKQLKIELLQASAS